MCAICQLKYAKAHVWPIASYILNRYQRVPVHSVRAVALSHLFLQTAIVKHREYTCTALSYQTDKALTNQHIDLIQHRQTNISN